MQEIINNLEEEIDNLSFIPVFWSKSGDNTSVIKVDQVKYLMHKYLDDIKVDKLTGKPVSKFDSIIQNDCITPDYIDINITNFIRHNKYDSSIEIGVHALCKMVCFKYFKFVSNKSVIFDAINRLEQYNPDIEKTTVILKTHYLSAGLIPKDKLKNIAKALYSTFADSNDKIVLDAVHVLLFSLKVDFRDIDICISDTMRKFIDSYIYPGFKVVADYVKDNQSQLITEYKKALNLSNEYTLKNVVEDSDYLYQYMKDVYEEYYSNNPV